MRARTLALPLLPSLALGSAFLLVHPAEQQAHGFSLNGDKLNPGQRDVRLFDNFEDASANDNVTPHPMFPGFLGAEMAIWKGVVEWSSVAHGDGTGDPTQPEIGSGGADFDPAWMGNASGGGGTDDNVVSALSSCGGGGTFAFAEGPYSNGWRIKFCDEWTWADGPTGNIGSRPDIQGIMVHEYGHALGLNHTNVTSAATMWPSTSPGATNTRSIHSDDIGGLRAIYGLRSPDKATITETSVSGSTLTIRGAYFDLVENDVWFCPTGTTFGNLDPRIRVLGVPSTNNGTEITVPIPSGVSAGDVLVKRPDAGGKSLSNAFPMNLVGTISVAPLYAITAMTPDTVEALDPGTGQSVTLTGFDLGGTTQLDLNGNVVSPASWTVTDPTTISVDLPQGVLGANTLTASNGSSSYSIPFTIVEPAQPRLEAGTGDPTFVAQNGQTMRVRVGGKVGTLHKIFTSFSPLPSVHPLASFDMGNQFTDFKRRTERVIGPDGYTEIMVPVNYTLPAQTIYAQSIDVTTPPSPAFSVSNLQQFTLAP